MCEISRQIYNDGKADGIKIGKADGIKIGKADGIKIGKADGIRIGQIKSYAELINKKIITINQALSSLNMSISEFLEESKKYNITVNM